jgi:DNA-binding transcriptional ArsR family regulator
MVTPVSAEYAAPPEVSRDVTVAAILARSKRSAVPIRRSFLQQGTQRSPQPGPLAELVRRGDERGLDLLLLVLAICSAHPFEVTLPSAVWARALGIERGGGPALSKTLRRLDDAGLVTRGRSGRLSTIHLLNEDGHGAPYVHPGVEPHREPHLKVPHQFWTGPDTLYRRLRLPGKAMLLIGSSLAPGFVLPQEKVPTWYGLSADTASRGLSELQDVGILTVVKAYRPEPLTPTGYAPVYRYTFKRPYGRRSVPAVKVPKPSRRASRRAQSALPSSTRKKAKP